MIIFEIKNFAFLLIERGYMKKNTDKQLLNDINLALKDNINDKERAVLTNAKRRLEKKKYALRIRRDIELELRPMAVSGKLTKSVGKIYLKIINGEYNDGGIFSGMLNAPGNDMW